MCDNNYYRRYIGGTYECWRTPPNNNDYEGPSCRYLVKNNPLIVIGCNPSTINVGRPDPTTVLVDGFCQRNEYGGYIMLNLYPYIAPSVGALPNDILPEIHEANIEVIREILEKNNNSDILFAFDQSINEKNYLYDVCYSKIRNMLIEMIDMGYIKEVKIKKLRLPNGGDGEGQYPTHFLRLNYLGIGPEQVELEQFHFRDFHI